MFHIDVFGPKGVQNGSKMKFFQFYENQNNFSFTWGYSNINPYIFFGKDFYLLENFSRFPGQRGQKWDSSSFMKNWHTKLFWLFAKSYTKINGCFFFWKNLAWGFLDQEGLEITPTFFKFYKGLGSEIFQIFCMSLQHREEFFGGKVFFFSFTGKGGPKCVQN